MKKRKYPKYPTREMIPDQVWNEMTLPENLPPDMLRHIAEAWVEYRLIALQYNNLLANGRAGKRGEKPLPLDPPTPTAQDIEHIKREGEELTAHDFRDFYDKLADDMRDWLAKEIRQPRREEGRVSKLQKHINKLEAENKELKARLAKYENQNGEVSHG